MVSIEEALKWMEEWAKKKIMPRPTSSSAGSPLCSLPRRAEKEKETEPSVGHQKEKRARRETIDVKV